MGLWGVLCPDNSQGSQGKRLESEPSSVIQPSILSIGMSSI